MTMLNEYMGTAISVIVILSSLIGLITWFVRLEHKIRMNEDEAKEQKESLAAVEKEIRNHVAENNKDHEKLAQEIYVKFAELKETIAVSERIIQSISFEQRSLNNFVTTSMASLEKSEARIEKLIEKIDQRLSMMEGKK